MASMASGLECFQARNGLIVSLITVVLPRPMRDLGAIFQSGETLKEESMASKK
jgi:hypothetical protein